MENRHNWHFVANGDGEDAMKCRDCGKELDGKFYYEPRFHGVCEGCHAKFARGYTKEAKKKNDS